MVGALRTSVLLAAVLVAMSACSTSGAADHLASPSSGRNADVSSSFSNDAGRPPLASWPQCGDSWQRPSPRAVAVTASLPARVTAAGGISGRVVVANRSDRPIHGSPGWLLVGIQQGQVVGTWSDPALTMHGPVTLAPGKSVTLSVRVPRVVTCAATPSPPGEYQVVAYAWVNLNLESDIGAGAAAALTVTG